MVKVTVYNDRLTWGFLNANKERQTEGLQGCLA